MAFAEKWVLQGDNLVSLGQFDEAIQKYQAALNFDPNYFSAEKKMKDLLCKITSKEQPFDVVGEHLSSFETYKKNKWIYRGLAFHVRKFTNDNLKEKRPFDWFNYGVSLLGKRETLKDAYQCFNRCLSLQPNYPNAWFAKGYCGGGKEAYIKGIQACNDGDFFYKDEPAGWNNKGYALGMIGEYDEAISTLEIPLSNLNLLNPHDIVINNMLLLNKIYSLSQLKKYDDVIQLCDAIRSKSDAEIHIASQIKAMTVMEQSNLKTKKWWQF
jgi:tetratricopeptide (TPR) repeat protein